MTWVRQEEMENEISKFMEVWLLVLVSLSYCYGIGKTIQKGFTRLLFLLPIICLFLYLPLNLSSVHFVGLTSFIIAWLANFKLLLFAFDRGPLSSKIASISLPIFVTLACLPIKIRQNPFPKSQNFDNPSHKTPNQAQRSNLYNYITKFLLLVILFLTYDYSNHIHPKIKQVIYGIHIYLVLELALAMVAYVGRAMLGLDLEPPFNEPYLSTSLQDFWGRRWNLIVSSILRPTIYDPALLIGARVIGRKFAAIPAVLATFLVSGIMHELIFYYLGRVRPTWEVFWFFILHGVCLTVEIALKRPLKGRCRLPTVVSVIFTLSFIIVTGFWLFFPQFIRFKAYTRAFEEYAALGEFLKKIVSHSSWLEFQLFFFA